MLGVEMYYTVKTLLSQGKNISEISRELGIDRKTVRKIIGETTVLFERPYGIKNTVEFLKLIRKRRVFIALNIGKKDFFSFRGVSDDIMEKLISLKNFKAPFVVVLEKVNK